MKKILSIAMVVALVASFAACKKDHTCSCTVSSVTTKTPLGKTTKKKAKEACDALNSAAAVAAGSCTLD